jgi:ppGpp synthetase/RelA/SpoT-type nucleotidyltranferase
VAEDFIDNKRLLFKKIEDHYEFYRKSLKEFEVSLNKDIESILDLFSKDAKLISNKDTAVNPTKYYAVKSRVKSTHSLKEKLIRKNLGLAICNKYNLTAANFEANHENVKNALFLIDDIIGVRIVTELKADCFKVHKLIKEKNSYFIGKGIVLELNELSSQPETMQNGLPIYRIKGIYKGLYGFELQIKSKIDEAWGDMDHSIFYKDYSVSPIKNTVQVTMNNVGHLLDKIEELLLGLRDSEDHFNDKIEEFDFLKDLSKDVFEEIKEKLGDNYELGKIASTLRYFKDKLKVKKKDIKSPGIKYNFLKYTVTDALLLNYISHRNLRFELIIMEALFIKWRKNTESDFVLRQNNYRKYLEEYLKILAESSANNANNFGEYSDGKVTKGFVTNLFTNFSSEQTKQSVFVDTEAIYRLHLIDGFINEIFSEYLENNPELEDYVELPELLISLYSKTYLKFKNVTEIEEIYNLYPDLREQNTLIDTALQLQEVTEERINNYKLEDRQNEFKKAEFLNDLMKKVLTKVRGN